MAQVIVFALLSFKSSSLTQFRIQGWLSANSYAKNSKCGYMQSIHNSELIIHNSFTDGEDHFQKSSLPAVRCNAFMRACKVRYMGNRKGCPYHILEARINTFPLASGVVSLIWLRCRHIHPPRFPLTI